VALLINLQDIISIERGCCIQCNNGASILLLLLHRVDGIMDRLGQQPRNVVQIVLTLTDSDVREKAVIIWCEL